MAAIQKSCAARFMVTAIETCVAQECSKRLIAKFKSNELTPEVAQELGYIDVESSLLNNQGAVDDQDLMVYDWPSLQAMLDWSSLATQTLIKDMVRAVQCELRITPRMVGTMQVIKGLTVHDPRFSPWILLDNPDKMRKIFGRLFFRRSRFRNFEDAQKLWSVFQSLGQQKFEYFPEF
jgi:hypothetical protein